MRLIIPTCTIFVRELCQRHQCITMHRIFFLEYNYEYHEVNFEYYCEQCYKELKDKAPVSNHWFTIEDWLELYTLDEESPN